MARIPPAVYVGWIAVLGGAWFFAQPELPARSVAPLPARAVVAPVSAADPLTRSEVEGPGVQGIPALDTLIDVVEPDAGPGGALRVRLKYGNSRPAGGKRVSVTFLVEDKKGGFDEIERQPQSTDARGEAFWVGLPPGRYEVRLMLGNISAPQGEVEVAAEAESSYVLTVPERLTIKGRVVDSAGRAVPGAKVSFVIRDLDTAEHAGLVSDAAGRFAWDDFEPGTYELIVTHPERGAARREVRAPQNDLLVTLRPGLTLYGTVSDAAGRVRSYLVVLSRPNGPFHVGRAVVSDGGNWQLDTPVPPGDYRLTVVAGTRTLSRAVRIPVTGARQEESFVFEPEEVDAGAALSP